MSGEGVIKFHSDHRSASLGSEGVDTLAAGLMAWRAILRRLGMVGRDPGRYEGFAFGNLSARLEGEDDGGAPRFLITGSQTGGKEGLTLADFCIVEASDAAANRVRSVGLASPSSESLTHDAVYRLDASIGWVFHVHSPEVWRRRAALLLPTSAPEIPYGSPGMADEVARLYRYSPLPDLRILAMGGHEDGVVSFGASAEEAGETLIRFFARAVTTILLEEETP